MKPNRRNPNRVVVKIEDQEISMREHFRYLESIESIIIGVEKLEMILIIELKHDGLNG